VNRYRFASQEFDPQTGLYAYLYRFYDPNSQRWLNRDPIQERGGINLYAYVANDPVNYIDPYGLYWGQGAVNSFGDWELNTYNSAANAVGNFLNNAFLNTTVQTDPNMYYAVTGTVTPITDANGKDITSSLLAQVATMPLMAATMGPEQEGADLLAGAKCEKPLTTVLSDVKAVSRGKVVGQGNVYLRDALEAIESGKVAPRDVFENGEGLLPPQPSGYYHEYDFPTPGVNGAGPQRIVRGAGGELYYTPNHYQSFVPLN
jgi:RHS repeat-associated protein